MMPYRIEVELYENEMEPDEAVSVINYLGEVLEIMGYSYSMNCFNDGKENVVHLESPKVVV